MPASSAEVKASEALSVRALHYAYPASGSRPPRDAIAGIDLDVAERQAVALLGPNGSGKSTLIKIVCGLLRPDSGTVSVFGQHRPAEFRSLVSVVFQRNGLDRKLTVHENLRDQAVLYGIRRRDSEARIGAELRRAGLDDRRNDLVRTLSAGLARRADLARAMLHRPRLLMLDEATAGLDPAAREAFLGHLLEGVGGPRTILMSTHLVDEAERCDRIILLHRGRVIADGSPSELQRKVRRTPLTVIEVRGESAPRIDGLYWRPYPGGRLRAETDAQGMIRDAVSRLASEGVSFTVTPPGPPTLAHVFEQLAGTGLDGDENPPSTSGAGT